MSTQVKAFNIQNTVGILKSKMSQKKVKEERPDEAEIREMAAKIFEANKQASAKAAAQQQHQQNNRTANNASASGQTNMLNYLTRKGGASITAGQSAASTASASNATTATKLLNQANSNSNDSKTKSENGDGTDKKPCDDESQRGHFGWATFGKTHIPYILRQAEKYCAVRMVEMKLLNKYLSYLHQDIYSCTCVRSYYITEAEHRLLNEINHKHCDSQFGREMFTLKDLVVRLSDANKFYQFLDVCYKKLLMGSSGPSDKCGFIRINKESVVPYTVRDNQKFVPLFYFEGETDNLKLKAEYLSGWDLSYLKFCCKVQGIRNELFASDSVAVISLSDIKGYFPTGTEFEDYWPSKVVDSQLLIGQTAQKTSNSVHWTKQPAAPPLKPNVIANNVPKNSAPARKTNIYGNQASTQKLANAATSLPSSAQNNLSAAVQALNWTQGLPAGILNATPEQLVLLAAQQQAQRGNYGQRSQQNSMLDRQTEQLARLAAQAQQNTQRSNYGQRSHGSLPQPPPLVRAASQSNNLSTAELQKRQQQQLQRLHQLSGANSGRSTQQQQQQNNNQDSNPKMTTIPEVVNNNPHHIPFKMQRVPIEGVSIPCVNLKPFLHNDFLMSLSDFNEYFSTGITLDTCKKVLGALGIELFMGNRHQYQAFKDGGKGLSENMPLIQVRDIMKYKDQLTYMIQHQEQPSAKRTRIS